MATTLERAAQFVAQSVRALLLGLGQLALGLRCEDLVHEGLEPTHPRAAQRAHQFERVLQLARVSCLQDELVLQLLLDGGQLRLGLGQECGCLATRGMIVVDELHLRPELLDLGPFEVEVERLEFLLQGGEALRLRL
ncbi:MAG TPA: hypothetical protein PLU66_04505 [Trueperaceae bacterium]|nr:hypothetical protein [Trueperaceae bacterium]